ncbi:FadR/GntR family transcriptional regulator [Actinomadura violacea]|uniref:FadR family transcriptional regulator n=1 Tax=Actinomadura violacea TaxID=2819934 RepID=A0ABS3RP11_9ACTN|nr:FCD domain-containing protein [Actinomadura violacea]MBO2458361.1 FadR family transcriptional regulator [Actinomadura violacea]
MTGPAGYEEATGEASAPRVRERGRPPAGAGRRPARPSRAESTAELLISLAGAASPGDRLGSKSELRDRCSVSVGTFNEAMRIAQSRGVVTVRPGPGGGVFAAEPSPMVRLGNSVLALDAGQTSVAEAMRIRDALDPLLIEDALWHASLADIAEMRTILAEMAGAVEREDATAFVHANWSLHARIAAVSPHAMLRSLYINLLDQIESHTLAVLPSSAQPLPEYISSRHALHEAIVDALESHDRVEALRLIAEHNTSKAPGGSELRPAHPGSGPA